MDKEKSYQMPVTYLNIDKVLFALFLVATIPVVHKQQ